jgi:pimeloyl-[acyl-carrier protein] synthase
MKGSVGTGNPKADLGNDLLKALPRARLNPYPLYSRLRAQAALLLPVPGMWLVTRYAEALSVLRDSRFSSDPSSSGLYKTFVLGGWGLDNAAVEMAKDLLVYMDPPRHTRIRALVNAAFSRRAVEELRPRLVHISEQLLDSMRGAGQMDVIQDLAYPFPARVIADILGVPSEEDHLVMRWTREMMPLFGEHSRPEIVNQCMHAVQEFSAYLKTLMRERTRAPRDDLMTALIEAEFEGERLTQAEVVSTCILLLIAGHETTANLIGNSVLLLLQHPNQRAFLIENPRLLPATIEEVLRYESPIQATARTTSERLTIAGEAIPEGQRVTVLLGCANRDPEAFSEAESFDIRRERWRHLAFAAGIHFCLGAPLARLEAQVAVWTLLSRFSKLELAVERPQWRKTFPVRGLVSLPVTF